MSTGTQQSPDEDLVTIQYGESAEAMDVAELASANVEKHHVQTGLELVTDTINWADGSFDLTDGKAFWLISEINDRSSDDAARHQCLFTAYYKPRTGISFDPGQKQYVFAVCNGVWLGDPKDAPKIVVEDPAPDGSEPEPPREDAFLFAVLDPATNLVEYRNQHDNGIFERVEAENLVITESLEADGLIDTRDLADKSVTEPKLDDDAVSQRAAGPDSIGSPERIDESVVEGDMADDAVSERVHQPDSVTQAILAAESVVAEHIVNGTLTTPKYGNRSITGAKIGDNEINSRALGSRSVTPKILDSRQRYRMAGLDATSHVTLEARSKPEGTPGASNGEVLRIGGTASDSLIDMQGQGGRLFWTYNAEFDGDEWQYIADGEPAMAIGMSFGRVRFWTANRGDTGERIDWEKCEVDNGGISNARALGDVPANGYLRKHGIVDTRGGELTLLNDWDSGRGRNTSHDLVLENQPSGDRVHTNYARPEVRMFEEGHFRSPFWVAMKNGNFRPGQALQLLSAGNVRAPPKVGVNAYYYNNDVRVVKDNGQRGTVQIDWS